MNCKICGKEIAESRYMTDILCSENCFEKNFWNEIIAEKDKYIIINNTCYRDGGKTPGNYFKGFGGRRFYIRYFDGREITTDNLWCQGDIPEEYQDILKNEAEFYYPEEKLIKAKGGANH